MKRPESMPQGAEITCTQLVLLWFWSERLRMVENGWRLCDRVGYQFFKLKPTQYPKIQVGPGQARWRKFRERKNLKTQGRAYRNNAWPPGWHGRRLHDLLEVFVFDISCSRHLCLMLPLSLDAACSWHFWYLGRVPCITMRSAPLNSTLQERTRLSANAHKRGSPHRRQEPLCAREHKSCGQFLTSKHHLYTAVPLRTAITAWQITRHLRPPPRQSTTWMQPLHCDRAPEFNFTIENAYPSHKRGSPHRRREPLCARKHRGSCDFSRPSITCTQQFHRDLPSLPRKSHYNCVEHCGNQHDRNQHDGCSHYTAICTPEFNFTREDAFERKRAKAGPVAQTRFPT